MHKLLIIEDETVIRSALSRFLQRQNFSIDEAGSFEEAQQKFQFNQYHLILTDIRLPGKPGTEILHHNGNTPVIIMTAYSSVQSAVEAMQMGAKDYIAKPFNHDELLAMINKHKLNQLQHQPVLQANTANKSSLVGQSDAINEIRARVAKIAPTEATVLILGESGTGKELLARELHDKSQRCKKPFITFNCAAVPQDTIETELFGSTAGANGNHNSLIESASGGTLFLDEIGELPLEAQARLLRILQQDSSNRDYNVRIIAATHRDLRKLVQDNAFRSDLYFRIRVMEMVLPPLRQRGDDIIDLSLFLLNRNKQAQGKINLNFNKNAVEAIRRYQWPGNVRELANAIERAVILAETEEITPELLDIDTPAKERRREDASNENLSLQEYFRFFVLEHQDHMTETELAKKLGISRKALWERRQRFGIPRPRKKRD